MIIRIRSTQRFSGIYSLIRLSCQFGLEHVDCIPLQRVEGTLPLKKKKNYLKYDMSGDLWDVENFLITLTPRSFLTRGRCICKTLYQIDMFRNYLYVIGIVKLIRQYAKERLSTRGQVMLKSPIPFRSRDHGYYLNDYFRATGTSNKRRNKLMVAFGMK